MPLQYSDFQNAGVVPVIKISRVETTRPLLQAIYAGGIRFAEITYRTACAKEAIRTAVASFPDMIIGAGTIINAAQAEEAADIGAQFLVSPGLDESIAVVAKKRGLVYFGGAVTPTEIMKAIALGLDVVKFFPAESFGGLAAIKALSAPFPQVKFFPTGGVSIKNIKEYLAFPKVLACGGSWMVKDELIDSEKYEEITALCKEARQETVR